MMMKSTEGITHLYIFRRADDLYDIGCDLLVTSAYAEAVDSAIFMFEAAMDDIAGARIGYARESGYLNIHADGGQIWTHESRVSEVMEWLNSQLLGAEA
jgi:hypothetical protein